MSSEFKRALWLVRLRVEATRARIGVDAWGLERALRQAAILRAVLRRERGGRAA